MSNITGKITTAVPWRLESDERGFRRVFFGTDYIYACVNQNKEDQAPFGPVTVAVYKTDGVFTSKSVGDLSINDAETLARAPVRRFTVMRL